MAHARMHACTAVGCSGIIGRLPKVNMFWNFAASVYCVQSKFS